MEKTRRINLNRYLYDTNNKVFLKIFDGCIIGRAKGDITFGHDSSLSTKHLTIKISLGEVAIVDMGTTNKTKVNGRYINSGKPTSIKLRDVIEIGNQTLILTENEDEVPITPQEIQVKRGIRTGNEGFLSPTTWTLGGQLYAMLMIFLLALGVPVFWGEPKLFFGVYYGLGFLATVVGLYYFVIWGIQMRRQEKGMTTKIIVGLFAFVLWLILMLIAYFAARFASFFFSSSP